MNWDLISELLLKLLIAIMPPLAAMATAYLVKAYQLKSSQLSESQRWLLDNFVTIAVKAAEQMYGAGNGDAKKQYVIDLVETWLAKYQIKMDLDDLVAQIEASVFDQFKKPESKPAELPQG